MRGLPLRDRQGQIVRWYFLLTEIDDRKRAEDALRQAQSDLARINRVTTMGELAASLAHEISRSPVQSPTPTSACEGSGAMNPISIRCARLPPEL
jgi:hypothetical protein